MGDELPSSHNITIFCPRTGDKTTEWIMELIKKQNDLNTENWRPISRKYEGCGSLLSLAIDDNSCTKIISSDHKLSFRFGDISVCGLKKAKAIKSGKRQVETPRNPPVSAEKEKPNKISESSEDLADDEDLDATITAVEDFNSCLTNACRDNCSLGRAKRDTDAPWWNDQLEKLRKATRQQYDSVIQEYLDLGHMKEVPPTHDSPSYHLPHHAVLKWRYFQYVFSADITKMYRQIWVDPKHTPFQRILFRNKEGDIRDFELKTVTFGVNCAPFLAIRVLQQLAENVQVPFPNASRIIQQHMYVDDVLAGANSVNEAQSSIRELQAALSASGFPLRKWTSNNKSVLKDVPAEHLLHSEFLDIDAESTPKTLGIRWRAKSDKFYFVPPDIVVEPSYTKREVLSQIARLFDPAGWLAPFIIRSKMFMQEIWLQNLGWDDKLPTEMSQRWQSFLDEYSDLNQIRVPRWIWYQPEVIIEHHGFCNASQRAYGAAIYIRVEMGQKILTRLLTAKTRVAPVKTVSLPRLELCGAVLLNQMVTAILPHMPSASSDIRCWTDSTIVLAWLRKPACNWTTFVANRVAKITQATPVDCWAHVRSEQNSADLASRGVSLHELAENHLWWHGPEWLQGPRELWPAQSDTLPVTELEQRAVKVHFVKAPSIDFLERFSKLDKALRVLVYVQRFLKRCRKGSFLPSSRPTSEEIREAERTLTSIAQRRAYGQELQHLTEKRPLPVSSPLVNLFPFIDQHGLLRACGRLTASKTLQYDERHPILLPYDCRLSRLIVQFTHQITLHGGSQLIVRLIRTKYWIPKIKNLVKAVVNPSKICTIYKKRLQTQLMGDFPTDRVSFSRAFTYTGTKNCFDGSNERNDG
ncbi:uncharacterized protein LOC123327126 [Drosophila simulans]|uniref:uncharacterized protein LOC123327126 n=1 Tax=Drosophila simulans TaxID=7240 RepID=UPI001D0F854B|nr:uncharacterized protein LOC123327126 [Drosophila simulans]